MDKLGYMPERLWEDINRVMIDTVAWVRANPQEDRIGFVKVVLDMMFERIDEYTRIGGKTND